MLDVGSAYVDRMGDAIAAILTIEIKIARSFENSQKMIETSDNSQSNNKTYPTNQQHSFLALFLHLRIIERRLGEIS